VAHARARLERERDCYVGLRNLCDDDDGTCLEDIRQHCINPVEDEAALRARLPIERDCRTTLEADICVEPYDSLSCATLVAAHCRTPNPLAGPRVAALRLAVQADYDAAQAAIPA